MPATTCSKPYAVVMTGSHPEYTSTEMWEAYDAYKNRGGRIMYLGGDGFYWRIAYHHECPGMIELRRAESGVRAWAAESGEYYQSFDGRYGGLWVRQGRSPQKLVGVGFSAQGFDIGSYYRRNPDSFKPEMAFVFEGVGKDELIGNFGLIGGGAAGLELIGPRSSSARRPTPTFSLHPSSTPTPITWCRKSSSRRARRSAATRTRSCRADIVFFETPQNGAVFSVGSISWAGSFFENDYTNNVSASPRTCSDASSIQARSNGLRADWFSEVRPDLPLKTAAYRVRIFFDGRLQFRRSP